MQRTHVQVRKGVACHDLAILPWVVNVLICSSRVGVVAPCRLSVELLCLYVAGARWGGFLRIGCGNVLLECAVQPSFIPVLETLICVYFMAFWVLRVCTGTRSMSVGTDVFLTATSISSWNWGWARLERTLGRLRSFAACRSVMLFVMCNLTLRA